MGAETTEAPAAKAEAATPDRAWLAGLVERCPDAVLASHDDVIVYANAAAAALLGEPCPAGLVGRSASEWLRPDDQRQVDARLERLRGGAARAPRVTVTIVRPDGSTRRAEGNATLLEGGPVATLLVVLRDVTEREQAEQEALEGEQEAMAVAEALPQLVWSADASGRIDWFNRRWREYTGQPPGAESLEAALPAEERGCVEALWRGALAREAGFELEHRLRGADGAYRWFLRRTVPQRDPGGRVARWFGTCTDIHDLKVSQEVLRQADRLKEDFLDMASHEFRTPLTALRLQVDLLRRNLASPSPARKRADHQLAVVDAQIDRLQALLGSLLDMSRITAGRFTLDLAPVDLAQVAGEAVERFLPEAQGRGIELRLTTGPAVGHWDRQRLDQVITNLVGNALKYGNGRPVEVEVEAVGTLGVLRVRDHGIGIAPESLATVFDRFERAGNTASVQGLGLGLWIAKKMVAAHGGEIGVVSALGQGSTFTVTLPRG